MCCNLICLNQYHMTNMTQTAIGVEGKTWAEMSTTTIWPTRQGCCNQGQGWRKGWYVATWYFSTPRSMPVLGQSHSPCWEGILRTTTSFNIGICQCYCGWQWGNAYHCKLGGNFIVVALSVAVPSAPVEWLWLRGSIGIMSLQIVTKATTALLSCGKVCIDCYTNIRKWDKLIFLKIVILVKK